MASNGPSEDDDSLSTKVLQLSNALDEHEHTQSSVEAPRGAIGEKAYGRLSRESFGNSRTSDRYADMVESDLDQGLGALLDNFQPRTPLDDDFDDLDDAILQADPEYVGRV